MTENVTSIFCHSILLNLSNILVSVWSLFSDTRVFSTPELGLNVTADGCSLASWTVDSEAHFVAGRAAYDDEEYWREAKDWKSG